MPACAGATGDMGTLTACTLLCLAAHGALLVSGQQQTPDYNAPGRPLSATPDMLKNDPTGRAHLLVGDLDTLL